MALNLGDAEVDRLAHRIATCRRRQFPAAFTLIEALVSITIAAFAGSVLLMGIGSSLQSTSDALEETIAVGMAQQLMDEVLGGRYAEGLDGYQVTLGPSAYESSGVGRQRYDDIDDYHGVRSSAPVDLWNIELGKDDGEGGQRHPRFQASVDLFKDWRQEIDVYYVDESDLATRLPTGQVSGYRVVEVRIIDDPPDRGSRELINLRRVVAYVPPLVP